MGSRTGTLEGRRTVVDALEIKVREVRLRRFVHVQTWDVGTRVWEGQNGRQARQAGRAGGLQGKTKEEIYGWKRRRK